MIHDSRRGLLAKVLDDEDPYTTPAVSELGQEAPERLVESFTCVAIMAAMTTQKIAGFFSIEEVFSLLLEEETLLIPNVQPNRSAAILLALGRTKEDAERLDAPTAVNSSFGLALSAVKDLARRTQEGTVGWAHFLSEAADRGRVSAQLRIPRPDG